jgi:hypothetical protein
MKTSELVKLLKQVELHRAEDVPFEGQVVPKSALMLVTLLNHETDRDNRYDLYRHILLECHITNKTAGAVKFAKARYEEFRDVTSLVSYSQALIENSEFVEGMLHARDALDLAIQKQVMVNYAAGNLVRQAIRTGSAERVNEALQALVDSTKVLRDEDCALETDWADEAEKLGGDLELISWIRSAARG